MLTLHALENITPVNHMPFATAHENGNSKSIKSVAFSKPPTHLAEDLFRLEQLLHTNAFFSTLGASII